MLRKKCFLDIIRYRRCIKAVWGGFWLDSEQEQSTVCNKINRKVHYCFFFFIKLLIIPFSLSFPYWEATWQTISWILCCVLGYWFSVWTSHLSSVLWLSAYFFLVLCLCGVHIPPNGNTTNENLHVSHLYLLVCYLRHILGSGSDISNIGWNKSNE